ncbi:MAG: DUF928 domain-containing protein [Leptolyngbyaceae cyanobacterium MO_188.B28]|nr:DUF928 domain-containing protein [Leptolyngbyaceae cyanobacterium MO_188.B28]
MVNLKYPSSIALFVVWGLASAIEIAPSKANSIQPLSNAEPERLQFVSPSSSSADDFEEEGRPTQRTAGGDRNACVEQLIALIPGKGEIQNQPEACGGESVSFPTLTVVESPTFWFYVPAQSAAGPTAEFVLLDDQEQPILIQPVALSELPGVVSVSPPHPLEIGKSYRWLFSVLVNPDRPSRNPAVEGIVRRIEPNPTLLSQIESTVSPRDHVAIYARHGIWQDALTTLGNLRRTTPGDPSLLTDWTELLGSVGLGSLASVPVVDCCQPGDGMVSYQ